jgi:hypothetical protein
MPEAEVVAHFAAMLPKMGQPQEDALRIVREIRDRSGVLVERRPGAFGFSHLTFQEYLTALDYASRSRELLDRIDDPWWHEVIALAAGIPGCDAAAIVNGFLNKKTPRSIFMATKCLETAISVPLGLRKKVEEALDDFAPVTDFGVMLDLAEIGLTVAPIYARRLLEYNADQKVWALVFFGGFVYEPVIPVLMKLTSDSEKTQYGLPDGSHNLTVGDVAISSLLRMARTSDRARAGLISALSKNPPSSTVLDWLKPWELLGDEFKPAVLGKRASTRARNTG